MSTTPPAPGLVGGPGVERAGVLSGCRQQLLAGGQHGQVAVKVIDDRGNELMVVRSLKEAEG